jgi:hypothetical protein
MESARKKLVAPACDRPNSCSTRRSRGANTVRERMSRQRITA